MSSRRLEVRLTRSAAGDLEAIHAYLKQHDAGAADRLLDALADRFSALAEFPERGSVPRELDRIGVKTYRQIVHDPYRIVYRVAERAVFVVLICDGPRDMLSILEARLLRR